MKLVYLEWTDTIANPNWFEMQQAHDWAEIAEWRVKDVGWIVKETKDYIVIASSWKVGDEWTDEQVKLLHHIPKGMVRVRKNLTIPTNKPTSKLSKDNQDNKTGGDDEHTRNSR